MVQGHINIIFLIKVAPFQKKSCEQFAFLTPLGYQTWPLRLYCG